MKQQLNDVFLLGFIGGNLEITNYKNCYIFHGKINYLFIDNNELKVQFDWFAKGNTFPPRPSQWKKIDRQECSLPLRIYEISITNDGNLFLAHRAISETTGIFPKNVQEVHPITIKGLQ